MFGDLSDAGSCVFAYLDINVFKAVKNLWEDFCFNNNFCQVNCVLCNLGETLTDVSLKLSIWVGDQCGKVWDSTLVNDSLGKFLGVFCDF